MLTGKDVHSRYGYSIDGYNDIDLMSDSLGIWVIYSNAAAEGNIIVAKLDPTTLKRVYMYQTKVKQKSVMNCFMVSMYSNILNNNIISNYYEKRDKICVFI